MIFFDPSSSIYFVLAQFPTDFGVVTDRVAVELGREEAELLFNKGDVKIFDVKKEFGNAREIHID